MKKKILKIIEEKYKDSQEDLLRIQNWIDQTKKRIEEEKKIYGKADFRTYEELKVANNDKSICSAVIKTLEEIKTKIEKLS